MEARTIAKKVEKREGLTATSGLPLLSPQIIEILLQLRGSGRGSVRQTASPRFRPQLPAVARRLRGTIGIALIDPIPLRLLEPVLELRAARFPRLVQQLLVRPIEIGIVCSYRAIQAGTLISRRGRVAWIPGRPL